MKRKICSFMLIAILLMTTLWGCNVNVSSTPDKNTEKTEITKESEEKTEDVSMQENSEETADSEAVSEDSPEVPEVDDRIPEETGKGSFNYSFNGDPMKEDLWEGYDEEIYLLLYDSNNNAIVKETYPASDSIISSLSHVISEQLSFEDVKAFYNEHEAAAVSASQSVNVYRIDVTDSFNDKITFIYNKEEIVFEVDKVEAEVLTFMYPTSHYKMDQFYTEGYQTSYAGSDYFVYAGGVQYAFKGTYSNYGKVELEESAVLDDAAYVGEYVDENDDASLEIAQNDDGTYVVQIGIFRLTTIDDGVGELREEGMKFTATDAAGNPIGGVITLEGQIATVTFTDSTWVHLPNGSAYQYTKSSDTPRLWKTY